MASWKLLRAVLMPRSVMLAAVPMAAPSKQTEGEKRAVRPSELPIYVDEIKRQEAPSDVIDKVSAVEELVGTVRRELCSFVTEVNSATSKVSAVVKENLEASNEILDYLREEENLLPRSGAIALSGITGLVVGVRGGFFKRLLYMTLGAGSMAALCYPKEAEDYFQDAVVEIRKVGLIGHHLATSILDDLRGSSSDLSDNSSDDETQKK